jgi:hypothetical protein
VAECTRLLGHDIGAHEPLWAVDPLGDLIAIAIAIAIAIGIAIRERRAVGSGEIRRIRPGVPGGDMRSTTGSEPAAVDREGRGQLPAPTAARLA